MWGGGGRVGFAGYTRAMCSLLPTWRLGCKLGFACRERWEERKGGVSVQHRKSVQTSQAIVHSVQPRIVRKGAGRHGSKLVAWGTHSLGGRHHNFRHQETRFLSCGRRKAGDTSCA